MAETMQKHKTYEERVIDEKNRMYGCGAKYEAKEYTLPAAEKKDTDERKVAPSRRRALYRTINVCDCPAGKCPVEISELEGKKGKKVKCPTQTKKFQVARPLHDAAQAYDDEERQEIGVPIEWVTNVAWKWIIMCKTRRQTHHLHVIDPKSGDLDESLEPILELLTKSLQVKSFNVESLQVKLAPGKSYEPYVATVQCSKDRGAHKECTRRIDASVVSKGLALAHANMHDGAAKERLALLLHRFESAVMEAFLASDAERVKKALEQALEQARDNVATEFTRCTREGCIYVNGYRCNPSERRLPNGQFTKITRCPDEGCRNEDGEPTWWCTLCGKKHMEHEHCPLPDPRADMSAEDLAFHDAEVRAGREQVCDGCGAHYAKDEGCDSVRCSRRGCGRHMCFGCGAEIGDAYIRDHLTYGPREHDVEYHWGCRRTFVRKAASNEKSDYQKVVRAWLLESVNSPPLMVEARFVLNDPLRPLDEGEGKEWLTTLVARAIEKGTLD